MNNFHFGLSRVMLYNVNEFGVKGSVIIDLWFLPQAKCVLVTPH